MQNPRTSVSFPPDLIIKIDIDAVKSGISRSTWIVQAVKERIKSLENTETNRDEDSIEKLRTDIEKIKEFIYK